MNSSVQFCSSDSCKDEEKIEVTKQKLDVGHDGVSAFDIQKEMGCIIEIPFDDNDFQNSLALVLYNINSAMEDLPLKRKSGVVDRVEERLKKLRDDVGSGRWLEGKIAVGPLAKDYKIMDKGGGVQARRVRKWKSMLDKSVNSLDSGNLVDIEVQIVGAKQLQGSGGWPSTVTRC